MMIPVLKEDRRQELENQPTGRVPQMTEEQSREISRLQRAAYLAAFGKPKAR
ncbi:TPA: hypothetical protein ACLEYZ_005805 [Pseudomonas aeruginosa]